MHFAGAENVVHCNLDWFSADAPVGNIVLLTRMELEGTARLTVTAGADGGDAVPGDNTTTASASVGTLASGLPLTPPVARCTSRSSPTPSVARRLRTAS